MLQVAALPARLPAALQVAVRVAKGRLRAEKARLRLALRRAERVCRVVQAERAVWRLHRAWRV